VDTKKRDELFIRIDERTRNIWRVLEVLEMHQREQNGFIRENSISSAKNNSWRKISMWILGIISTAIIALTIIVVA